MRGIKAAGYANLLLGALTLLLVVIDAISFLRGQGYLSGLFTFFGTIPGILLLLFGYKLLKGAQWARTATIILDLLIALVIAIVIAPELEFIFNFGIAASTNLGITTWEMVFCVIFTAMAAYLIISNEDINKNKLNKKKR